MGKGRLSFIKWVLFLVVVLLRVRFRAGQQIANLLPANWGRILITTIESYKNIPIYSSIVFTIIYCKFSNQSIFCFGIR